MSGSPLDEEVERIAHELRNALAFVVAFVDMHHRGIGLHEIDWENLAESVLRMRGLAYELSDVRRWSMRVTVKFDDRGEVVATLHQRLLERGIAVSVDEVAAQWFGPHTRAAVHDFQAKHALGVDFIVGPRTWQALESATDFAGDEPRPIPTGLSPFAAEVLNIAHREYLRPVVEDPVGSNRGREVDHYLNGHRNDGAWLLTLGGVGKGAPWCGRFALWCIEAAALNLGVPSPLSGWGDLASAEKWLEHGREKGHLKKEPAPGDVGCILTGGHGHVVLVVDVDKDTIWTREGNSANRVAARKRKIDEFTGFVRPT